MLDQATTSTIEAAVRSAAEDYCRALHEADVDRLAQIFHEESNLYASQDDVLILWPRRVFLDRVASRKPGEGAPRYEIEAVDVAGPEMASVRLSVSVGERRFTDYLNFLRVAGEWRVIGKIFRVADGPKL